MKPVVRRREQQALSTKGTQLPWVVVDQVICGDNGLFAAKHHVRRRNEGEVLAHPAKLRRETHRYFHGRGCHVDIVVTGKPLHHPLRLGHDRQSTEEVRLVKVRRQVGVVFLWNGLPEPFAVQVGLGKVACANRQTSLHPRRFAMNQNCYMATAVQETGQSAEVRAAANVPWKPSHNPWLIALTVTLATFMEVLDTSIANVALPHIAGGLGASQDEATWVITSYLVANAIILPASAYLTSFVGR